MSGILYLVPTPIGNLKDFTFRAVEILQSVDLILAEDTRTSSKLLQHYQISTPMRALHMHNEHKVVEELANQLAAGQRFAVISDAGTPGLSDPGFLMARAAIQKEVEVITLPGANAALPALINSGLPAHSFCFEGFLPPKKGRQSKLKELAQEKRSMIFYESPYRIEKTLRDLMEHFGADRPAAFSREISKKFEETRRGSLAELAKWAGDKKVKGEFVLVVGGKA